MSTNAERRFTNLRKRLDQLGYRQPLGVESLPLVEKLFSDLVHTTESLRSAKLSAGKTEKECSNYDTILEPYKTENAKLTRENNELHLEILKLKEQSDRHVKDLKVSLRRAEHEASDLKFLNNQYIHKIKMLEKENKAKTEKIQHLQEKNLQAVVQTPDRIPENVFSPSKVELRDKEIERLLLALDGGRSHEVISLESRTKSNEKLIVHLNLQVEYLQQKNKELENRIQDLLDTKQNVTSEVVHLSNKNEELCQELNEIDHLAQQLERHKEIVLETADKEIGEAKELCSCRRENEKLSEELFGKTGDKENLELLLNQLQQEKQRLTEKTENLEIKVCTLYCSPCMLTNNNLFKSQDELNRMRREAKHSLVSQSHAEEERDIAVTDFRRLMSEKESLREKLKIQQEAANLEKSKMQHDISELESNIQGLEMERCELKTTVSILKERINYLENELKLKSSKLAQTSDDSSQFKAEICSLQLLNDQLQRSVEDLQCRLSLRKDDLQSAQEEIIKLKEKIDRLNQRSTSQDEAMNLLRSTIAVLDKEKDSLQETVDEKTERIACLDDNLANKVKGMLSNRDREISSLHRQLDSSQAELAEIGRVKEMALKENRRLQDDLATIARENQAISTELEDAIREKEEMKTRVHNYIAEVSRFETLMASKEQENQELLEKFQMLHTQAEDWEMKAHQAEGESSSIRLELLSVDTDRRHLRERVELLEKEIQGHIVAHQVYESQISSITKNMSKLEEDLKRENHDKTSVLADLTSVRELCVKLESSKELLSRQLTSKSMDYERVLGELEDIKSEVELLKKQLSSERLTVQNLETLLATSRDKEFQNQLTSQEKDTEIQLLKDKLTLAESKLSSHSREVSILRSKAAQLQTDCDVLKRQLTTERFERSFYFLEKEVDKYLSNYSTSQTLDSDFSLAVKREQLGV
ncbi:Testis-specific protein 10 protein [Willisornis vidua]|uniref:Testis-specific protein 10 protein n=1 Tax=Willisornis vidua TaxID=1566151 RepID=A0ABQ9CZB3_9PASS|nr:Testis-specific protein 10 protein [Willisornis vidua]